MELDDLSSGSRKRLDRYGSNRPLDATLPGRTADSELLLRCEIPHLLFRTEKAVIDEPFESRLLEANQEFAIQLQEACALPNCAVSSQTRSVSEILVRALPCS